MFPNSDTGMRNRILPAAICFGFCLLMPSLDGQAPKPGNPHLEKRGQATQLIVDGQPMVMLAGELHNSSSSSLEYMKPEWKQLADMGLNTVLTPTSWELIEPVEGQFDFALVDGLLKQAREQHLHIVFLWLAAWKNGVSGYPPVWVKRDTHRFPRVIEDGKVTSTLSPLSAALREADAHAFKALMAHLRIVDGGEHTVLMVQVENEVGVLGAARDHSPAAEQAFAAPVPEDLMRYLVAHHESLNKELRSLWEQNGAKAKGTWTEVFGEGLRADEIFMAWQYGRYVQAVAAAGKTAYPLPMYANAWLGEGDAAPGNYPSGGPQPRVLDVWKAAGDGLDMLSPDLYASDIVDWSTRYHRPDNPLFLPETNGGSAGAANIFYILGEQSALGFSPFGIDTGPRAQAGPGGDSFEKGRTDLTDSYTMLQEVMPELTRAQESGDAHGFLLSVAHPSVDFVMHGITVHVSLDEIFGHRSQSGYGLILEEQPNHFLGVGKGFRVSFSPVDSKGPGIGLDAVDEGEFQRGVWIPGRRLNGDEDDQGGNWRFDSRQLHIERATIYAYQ